MSLRFCFAATNPCHVYEMALALHRRNRLSRFLCGYPEWKLHPPAGFPYRQIGWRTLATYGLLRLPRRWQPDQGRLFRWQDVGFARRAVRALPDSGVVHGIPGQCLELFQAAREKNLTTVLNHASGPLEQQLDLVEPEYVRANLPFTREHIYPSWWIERMRQEAELAHYHCAASSIVASQLAQDGIDGEAIIVVPYGADPQIFPKRTTSPEDRFRIVFAGQLSLRKGVHYLLKALEQADSRAWQLDCFGPLSPETEADFGNYTGAALVRRHGPVSQSRLAGEMARASVLVLPSAEEAFGLVVSQALQVGLPCVVSDRVGAGDLIEEGVNGSIVPFADADALATALTFWRDHPTTVPDNHDWERPAEALLHLTDARSGQAPTTS